MGKQLIIFTAVFFIAGMAAGLFFETAHAPQEAIVAPTPLLIATASPSPVPPVTAIFVGDIMLSRSVGKKMVEYNDFSFPFRKIADFLKNADITFGNLEGPISSRGVKVGSIYSFRADPRTVEGMMEAGFDVLSIANNHMWDYGRDAFTDTLGHLRNASISYAGGGRNSDEAHAGIIKDIRGNKIGFLAYTDLISRKVSPTADSAGVAFAEPGQIGRDIASLKEAADIVIVSFHWGEEYKTIHNAHQEIMAKAAIDAGADLIIGHHPHVVQDIGEYKGKWIVYSLGNFVFDQGFSDATMQGLAVKVIIENKKITALGKFPVILNENFQPEPALLSGQ